MVKFIKKIRKRIKHYFTIRVVRNTIFTCECGKKYHGVDIDDFVRHQTQYKHFEFRREKIKPTMTLLQKIKKLFTIDHVSNYMYICECGEFDGAIFGAEYMIKHQLETKHKYRKERKNNL